MCEPGRTRARPSRSVRTTTILEIRLVVGSRSAPKFFPCVGWLRETRPIWRSGARGHIRSRAMGDESPPRSRSPAPRDDRSRSPAPRDDRSRSPARGDSPPRARLLAQPQPLPAPRCVAARPPATEPRSRRRRRTQDRRRRAMEPARFRCVRRTPESPLSSPFVSRAPATLPPVPTIRARPPFRANCHPPDSNTGSRARPPEKHARSSSRPSSPCSTVTSKRVATRRVDTSSRTSSVRPHPHHT